MSNFFAMIRKSFGAAPEKISRSVAKDRLSVMLVHQRNSDYVENIDMDALRHEVAIVIKKYVKVAQNKPAALNLKQDGDFDFLEMHFQLEQNSLSKQQLEINRS